MGENKIEKRDKAFGALLVFISTVIWGFNYIAQSEGSKYMGPFTFNFFRVFLGTLTILPVILIKNKKTFGKFRIIGNKSDARDIFVGGILSGCALIFSVTAQQAGIAMTTVGKAGFLTSLSVVFVPILNMFFGKKVYPYQTAGIILSLLGVGLLSLNGIEGLSTGDLFLILTAFLVAIHLTINGKYTKKVDVLEYTFFKFIFAGLLALVFMYFFENPDINSIKNAKLPVLYSGIFASGIAFSVLGFGQSKIDNTTTSLIMSMESVFAAICGWIFLNQTMTRKEIAGCIIIFISVLWVQLYPELKNKISDKKLN